MHTREYTAYSQVFTREYTAYSQVFTREYTNILACLEMHTRKDLLAQIKYSCLSVHNS